MDKRCILVVDDNAIDRAILNQALQEEYTVLVADSGHAALDIMRQRHGEISVVVLDLIMPGMSGFEVLETLKSDEELSPVPIIVSTSLNDDETREKAVSLGADNFVTKPYNRTLLLNVIQNTVRFRETAAMANALRRDALTGLLTRYTFCLEAEQLIKQKENGYYILSCFDVENFKVINDQYGTDMGDEVLKHIGRCLGSFLKEHNGLAARYMADKFMLLYPAQLAQGKELAENHKLVSQPDCINRAIRIRIGRYLVTDRTVSIRAMFDRAEMAEQSIKGRYDNYIANYDGAMLENLLREQKIVNEMLPALERGEFEPWFQPQYNHATGALIGAEALVRWRRNGKIVPPFEFIPIFERNGFIYEVDRFVWRQVCILQRRWLDEGRAPLPVSVNISRVDIYQEDFIDYVSGLVREYDLPSDMLRLEITESAFSESTSKLVTIVNQLIDLGFTVEIDDFGSGYSSLNTLKDVPASILKLDMKFFSDTKNSQRSGNIIESVVRMAKWLGMAVIAEGVEDKAQADYLKSIGCYYIQGYFYAKPMPLAEFEECMEQAAKEPKLNYLQTLETLDSNEFWNPKSMETLIFNSYVGGACIFEYAGGRLEMLRVNERFRSELGAVVQRSSRFSELNMERLLNPDSRKILINTLLSAARSRREESCELTLTSGEQTEYIRMTLRRIAHTEYSQMYYAVISNFTSQRLAERRQRESARKLDLIMKNIGGGVSATTMKDGKIEYLFSNDRFYELIGYTKQQYESECPAGLRNLIYPEDRGEAMEKYYYQIEHNTDGTGEFRVKKRDGSTVWLHVDGTICYFDENTPANLAVYTDITEMKKIESRERETLRQLEFLNDSARSILAQPDTELAINETLESLLQYFDGDRAYVFEMDEPNNVTNNTYERCAPGVNPEKERLRNTPMSTTQYWFDAFLNNELVVIPDVSAIDDSQRAMREILQVQDITSLIVVPLYLDSKCFGFLGVDNPTRAIDQTGRLAAIGDYIAILINRRDLLKKIERDALETRRMINDVPGGFVRAEVFENRPPEIVAVNEGFCRMLQMTREELMTAYGDNAYLFLDAKDRNKAAEKTAEGLKDSDQFTMRCRLRRKTGVALWVMAFGRVSRDENGRSFLSLYFNDISAQIETQQQLELIMRYVPGGLAAYHINEDGIDLSYCNDGYYEIYGYTREEYRALSACNPFFNVHEDDVSRLAELVASFAEDKHDGRKDTVVYRCYTKDGRICWVLVNTVLSETFDGRYMLYLFESDITEQQEEREKLHMSEELNRLAMEQTGKVIGRLDIKAGSIYLPEKVPEAYGLPSILVDLPEGQIRKGVISPETADEYRRLAHDSLRGEPSGRGLFQVKSRSGWRWIDTAFTTVFSSDGSPNSAVFSFTDVTEQLEKDVVYSKWQQSLKLRDSNSYTLFRINLSRGVGYDTVEGTLLPGAGFVGRDGSFSDITRQFAERFVVQEDRQKYIEFVDAELMLSEYQRGHRSDRLDFRLKEPQGSLRWLRLSVELVENPNTKDIAAYLMYEDINDTKSAEIETKNQAETDALTGLLNRKTIIDRMNEQLGSRRPEEYYALLYIDIDNFKGINDRFGHLAGDQVLIDVGRAIRSHLWGSDLVCRMGGDEFLVCMNAVPGRASVEKKATRISAAIKKFCDPSVNVAVSIGIALCPTDGEDFETLYYHVDSALYSVKENGKNSIAFYESGMDGFLKGKAAKEE